MPNQIAEQQHEGAAQAQQIGLLEPLEKDKREKQEEGGEEKEVADITGDSTPT